MNLISTITYQYIYLGTNWITVLSRFKDYRILLNT